MRIEVVTLFPQLVEAGLAVGVLGRAVTKGRVGIGLENPRSHAEDPHRTVDDRPFGGGPGMVLKAEPLARAVAAVKGRLPEGAPVIGLSAHGRPFDQAAGAAALGPAGLRPGGRALRGHRPARDRRAGRRGIVDRRLCALGRRVPGAHRHRRGRAAPAGRAGRRGLGAEDSFGDGLLDWPHYTRPEVWDGRPVPPVLLGGNHAAIRRWRLMQALGRTWQRRPDLLAQRELTPEEQALLEEFCSAAGVEPPRGSG